MITGWTKDEDTYLGECLEKGMSFMEIAASFLAKFRIQRSKNSCLGRARRIGFASKLTSSDGARKRNGSQGRVIRVPALRIRKPKAIKLPNLEKLRCVEIDPLHKAFSDLDRGDCRYPYGDGPFTFCGHPTHEGKPYCIPHWALSMPAAIAKPQTREERELRIRSFARNDRAKRIAEASA
jgi:GcrA cell cycle regulator